MLCGKVAFHDWKQSLKLLQSPGWTALFETRIIDLEVNFKLNQNQLKMKYMFTELAWITHFKIMLFFELRNFLMST